MKMSKNVLLKALCLSVTGFMVYSCNFNDGIDIFNDGDGDGDGEPTEEGTIFENKSSLEPLVAIQSQFNFVEAYSLISSTDVLENGFRLVGAQDGAGFLRDGDGYMYVVNGEDNYAVSRIRFDKNLNPLSGDYLLNSGVADFARQCSGTMWEASIPWRFPRHFSFSF